MSSDAMVRGLLRSAQVLLVLGVVVAAEVVTAWSEGWARLDVVVLATVLRESGSRLLKIAASAAVLATAWVVSGVTWTTTAMVLVAVAVSLGVAWALRPHGTRDRRRVRARPSLPRRRDPPRARGGGRGRTRERDRDAGRPRAEPPGRPDPRLRRPAARSRGPAGRCCRGPLGARPPRRAARVQAGRCLRGSRARRHRGADHHPVLEQPGHDDAADGRRDDDRVVPADGRRRPRLVQRACGLRPAHAGHHAVGVRQERALVPLRQLLDLRGRPAARR